MSKQILRDSGYRIIGHLDTNSAGRKTLYDARYQILGYYDPAMNYTYNNRWQIVGRGDILTSLLRP